VPTRSRPKSYRQDDEDVDLARELMAFYGFKTETQLISSALRALNRERRALEDLYVRPAKAKPLKVDETKTKR
jgi:hypothetical protein